MSSPRARPSNWVNSALYSYMIVAVSLHKTHIRVVKSLVKLAAVSWHSLQRFIKPASGWNTTGRTGRENRAREPGERTGRENRAREPGERTGRENRAREPGERTGRENRAREPGERTGRENRAREPGEKSGFGALHHHIPSSAKGSLWLLQGHSWIHRSGACQDRNISKTSNYRVNRCYC